MASEQKLILRELEKIRHDISYIKQHMIDADAVLDTEDSRAIRRAEREFSEGKTIPLAELKKHMGI